MPTPQLFFNDSWDDALIPVPFDSMDKTRTDTASTHNTATDKKSTLHGPTLRAIMAYLNLDAATTTGQPTDDLGAVGSQNNIMDIVEYPSTTGIRHAVVYTRNNGKIYAGKQTDPSDPGVTTEYLVSKGFDTGSAIFFALIPRAMEDQEFGEYYTKLKQEFANGFSDMDALSEIAHKLCDNMYRRIVGGVRLPNGAGIGIDVKPTGKIPKLTPAAMAGGTYLPTSITFGWFKVFTGTAAAHMAIKVPHKDFVGKYPISPDRILSDYEKQFMHELPEYYEIPQEMETNFFVVTINGKFVTKLTKRNLHYAAYSGYAKQFETARAAEKWIEQYDLHKRFDGKIEVQMVA